MYRFTFRKIQPSEFSTAINCKKAFNKGSGRDNDILPFYLINRTCVDAFVTLLSERKRNVVVHETDCFGAAAWGQTVCTKD